MHISKDGLALIKRFEGFCPTPYDDPAGYATIGYGHLIKPGEVFTELTTEQGESLLREDVAVAEAAVTKNVRITLTQGQFDALVSFVFNVGSQAFEKSYLLRLLNNHDPKGAARQFSRWIYAGGRRLPGLIARRSAENKLFSSVTAL